MMIAMAMVMFLLAHSLLHWLSVWLKGKPV
jgi:hypothetical protein